MENASKALIIAGSILIAIMIISLGVLVFNNFGGKAKEMANMDEQEIKVFNSKITPYLGNAIKGSQVNALLQYCLSVNMNAKQTGESHKIITVSAGTSSLNGDSNSFTRVETGTKTYKVQGTYNDGGLLTNISITQNP